MSNLQIIEKVCLNAPGVKFLAMVPANNVNISPSRQISIANPNDIYGISFVNGTATFKEDKKTGTPGDYYIQTLDFLVSKRREEMELLISGLRNSRVNAYYIDKNNNQGFILNARFIHKYSTGSARGINGYTCQLVSSSIRKHSVFLSGNTGNGDNGNDMDECCITISTAQLNYVPSPSGNVASLSNKMVKGSDNNTYFVDKNLNSIRIGAPVPNYEYWAEFSGSFVTISNWFGLPNPATESRASIARRLWVKRGTDFLIYGIGNSFTIDPITNRITFDDPIELETIEIWQYPEE